MLQILGFKLPCPADLAAINFPAQAGRAIPHTAAHSAATMQPPRFAWTLFVNPADQLLDGHPVLLSNGGQIFGASW
jgi:hypothetical protein